MINNTFTLNDYIPEKIGSFHVKIYQHAIVSFYIKNTIIVYDKSYMVQRLTSHTPYMLENSSMECCSRYVTDMLKNVYCLAIQLLLYKLGIVGNEENCYSRI